jgi:recombinational DNA repair protein (RecF pathway)
MLQCRCARCGKWIKHGETTGESQLFSPTKAYTLCEPCWLEEEVEIEAEGTNAMPAVIASYEDNLKF